MQPSPVTPASSRKEPAKRLPRPPGPPKRNKGVVAQLRYGLNFVLDPIGFVAGRFLRYGDVYCVSSDGSPDLYVFRHPDDIREILINQANKFNKEHTAFRMLSETLGDGLLTSEGESWRRQRRLIQPAFGRERLSEYATAMVEESARTVDAFRAHQIHDMAVEMMELTLRIVSRTLLGRGADSQEAQKVRVAMRTLQNASVGMWMMLPIPRWASPGYRSIERANRILDGIIYGLIEECRNSSAPRRDLLSQLLALRDREDGSRLSDREIRDQLLTLYIAGHETTANALTWALYLLSQHPEAQKSVVAELRDLGDRMPTYDDLPRLSYLDRVVTEAMRLYPPVPVLARAARQNVTIGRWTIPAGSEVVLWLHQTHHDPRWFPEPWSFRPDRWLPEEIEKRPKLSYLPFGAGGRACIGKVFAQQEAVLVLATLLSRFRFELKAGHPVDMRSRITLSPRWGLPMIAHPISPAG